MTSAEVFPWRPKDQSERRRGQKAKREVLEEENRAHSGDHVKEFLEVFDFEDDERINTISGVVVTESANEMTVSSIIHDLDFDDEDSSPPTPPGETY